MLREKGTPVQGFDEEEDYDEEEEDYDEEEEYGEEEDFDVHGFPPQIWFGGGEDKSSLMFIACVIHTSNSHFFFAG